ncbi:MAG: type II toxin-antitoxin system death-on-curing family toxin [Chlamydiota bacterium]
MTALWWPTAGIGTDSANQAAYGKPDTAALAAAYAYGLVRNHPFADGNKRTGWVVARVFLADNGFRLQFDPADAVRAIEALAADKLTKSELGVVPGTDSDPLRDQNLLSLFVYSLRP